MYNSTNLEISQKNFECLSKIVYEESGIILRKQKIDLIKSRLSKRLRELKCRSFDEYCTVVENNLVLSERKAMIQCITTNVTRFFREPHHFSALRSIVLPSLISNMRGGKRIRIWSAACSSGEEAYSISMCLNEFVPDINKYDILILATDIDGSVLDVAKRGMYKLDVKSDIPNEFAQMFRAHTTFSDGHFNVVPSVKRLVRFAELNLNKSWPMRERFDVIFCRNAAIYFDQKTQNSLWLNFSEFMSPNGHLFIGHSERVNGSALSKFRSFPGTHYQLI